MKVKENAIVKFNGGNLALLCNHCRTTLKTGKDFSKEELDFTIGKINSLEPRFCENCKKDLYLRAKNK